MKLVVRQTTGGLYILQNGMRQIHSNQYYTRKAAAEAIDRIQKGLVKFNPAGILIEKEDMKAMGIKV